MKTVLSERDSKILEDALVKFGNIITTQELYSVLGEMSREQALNVISRLSKRGWLVRIKHGTYSIADFSSRGYLGTSQLVVAQTLCEEAYISMEAALQYYGMHDQLLHSITSICLVRKQDADAGNSHYTFVSTQKKYFYGFEEKIIEGKSVNLATIEKALIDLVQFNKSVYTVDFVIEKLQVYMDKINFKRLIGYLKKSTIATCRIFGFIFDLLGINSEEIEKITQKHTSTTSLSKESHQYQVKWRLYTDSYFDKYQKSL